MVPGPERELPQFTHSRTPVPQPAPRVPRQYDANQRQPDDYRIQGIKSSRG